VLSPMGGFVSRSSQNRQVPAPKMARVLRPYHYLTIAKKDREDARLVRERVKCGKPSCRCARDVRYRHGPYLYLRYEEYDRRTGGGSTSPRWSSHGCGGGSGAPALPAPVGGRSWAFYAATLGGSCIANGAGPGCGPSARSRLAKRRTAARSAELRRLVHLPPTVPSALQTVLISTD